MRSCRALLPTLALLVLAAPCFAPCFAAEPAATWREPSTGMEFVWVPAGILLPLDDPASRDPYFADDPDRIAPNARVAGFWLGRFEVTQAQWRRVMGANPARHKKGGAYPVESVSLAEVRQFLHRLEQLSGGQRFRLPTEAEWEYAARSGGRPERYAGGGRAGAVAWHRGNSGGATHPVGRKAANGLGLFDMSGNVREWCGGEAASAPPADALGALLATHRGGGYDDPPTAVNAIGLGRDLPDFRRADLGLRLVRANP